MEGPVQGGRSPVASLQERGAKEATYLGEAGRKAFICSLSGGVDSAVSALVAQRAAPSATVALMLPCSAEEELRGERGKDIADAQLVARHLQVPFTVINLSELWGQAVGLYEGALRELAVKAGIELSEDKLRWAVNNLKPTLRMMTAGFFADALEGLTIGTDNAIENFLGYFSVRGDGIADRQPIRDCTKGEVRQLAAAGGLPREIVERTPTAGLWPGQTDEDELGFTYAEADAFFLWLLDQHVAHAVFDETMTVLADRVEWILAQPSLPVGIEAASKMVAQNRRTAFKRTPRDLAAILERRGLVPRT